MAEEQPAKEGWLSRFPALRGLGGGRRRIPVIRQLAATECGPACLAMVLSYHGKTVSFEELRDVFQTGRDGTTASDLLRAARHYGLRGRGARLEVDALDRLPRATILHWGFNHFIVFDRLRRNGIDVVDPEIGRRFISMDEVGKTFTGVALLFEPSETFQTDGVDAKRRHGWEVLRDAGDWGRILTMSILLQALALVLPVLTGAIVDRVVPRGDRHMLLMIAIGLGAVVVFQLLASLIRAHLLLHMRTLADARVTFDFVEHLIGLPYAFFQRRSTGDVLIRLNSNVLIRQTLTSGALSGVLDGMLMLSYFVLLFIASPSMALIALGFVVLQVGIFLMTRDMRKEANATVVARQTLVHNYQVEMFTGIETLKGMGAERRAQEIWSNLFVNVLNATIDEGRLAALVESVTSTLRIAAPLTILAYGALAVVDGDMTLGTMLAVNTFAIGIFTPLSNLVSTATQFQLVGTYLEKIADVRESPLEQDPNQIRSAPTLAGRVEVDRVTFRYGPLEPIVIDDVSLTIEPGQFVAIVGRSGSGKSTLASLLMGLHAPTSGRVLYDQNNLADLDLRSVRRQIGVVTQRAHVFGRSIRSNIALAAPGVSIDVVIEVAKLAQIHDEIMKMPMGYDTPLINLGSTISGGQRQRITLARALVRKPAILILDEATSALDAMTERNVQDALGAVRCTRIVVAHRLSSIMAADCIFVMEGGKLVEQGSHQELIDKGGVYAALVESQLSVSGVRSAPSP